MEKPVVAKSKIKFLMLLPRAAAAVKLQNYHPFSPRKVNVNKIKSHQDKGFSGPITSVVFEEARNKSKNSSFDAKEPTSPKISCMGQIKHKKKISNTRPKGVNPYSSFSDYTRNKPSAIEEEEEKKKKKKKSSSRNIFHREQPRRKSDASADEKSNRLPDRAATLSQMKRFASGRDTSSKYDWITAQVAPEGSDDRRYYSDDERRGNEEEEYDDEVIIPFSAPIHQPVALSLEPRKEINLWKRRTMAQPKPLQLKT